MKKKKYIRFEYYTFNYLGIPSIIKASLVYKAPLTPANLRIYVKPYGFNVPFKRVSAYSPEIGLFVIEQFQFLINTTAPQYLTRKTFIIENYKRVLK